MFPYSPQAAEDEPTMTDLRGGLPAQRPPVDATVLDEPTSEVPMIRPPANGTGPEPEPETATVEADVAETDLVETDLVETDLVETAAVDAAAVEAETVEPAALDDASFDEATADDTTDDDAPDLAAGTEAGAGPETTAAEPTTDPTTPEVPDMLEPAPATRSSEMAKMTWTPVPRQDPPPEPPPAGGETAWEALPAPGPEPAAPVSEAGPPSASEPGAAAGRPGDVAELPIAVWSGQAADRLRDQWRELQAQFIDDPDAAVAGAKDLVTEAVHQLADTLLAAQDALDPYRGSGRVDTETMRVAMRRYREFLERVLAL